MITLKEVTIPKYKCIEKTQTFKVEEDTTILVGMNESGKTSALEAIAKSNYFTEDENFKFNVTHDYPRLEKKELSKSGENPIAITGKYLISEELLEQIQEEFGSDIFNANEFEHSTKYDNTVSWKIIDADFEKFIESKQFDKGINEELFKIKSKDEFEQFLISLNEETEEDEEETEEETQNNDDLIVEIQKLEKYFVNEWKWENNLSEYIARIYLKPNLPKFLYYDEYYTLPSRISIEELQTDNLENEQLKTAKALFELSDINIEELINADDFEDFIAELEATEGIISKELFKYWKTNSNLNISFRIDKVIKSQQNAHNHIDQIVEHILDIRVKNTNRGVSLPLKRRSKGFNWFFSFLVWFKKIQEDKNANYILLLDEPGLNLHAKAQEDLLNFIEDLSENYQIIFTTHSPFMISPTQLDRVRTVLETSEGTMISDSIQEKDPNTLFPLQAALGYDIAQNLFISKNNLLVEGVSDLIYLNIFSGILESIGKKGLKEGITIVPVGGLDKVSTFISLLRGQKLNLVCLLDTFIDPKGKAKVEDLIKHKIIKKQNIKFFDEFVTYNRADIEDLFTKNDYLKIFNAAFTEYDDIKFSQLNSDIENVLIQINKHLNIKTFNHYRPANKLAQLGVDKSYFNSQTIENFEKLFVEINKLF